MTDVVILKNERIVLLLKMFCSSCIVLFYVFVTHSIAEEKQQVSHVKFYLHMIKILHENDVLL